MTEKKPPQKPTNLRPYLCDLTINKQGFIKLEISPYHEKHNKEYLEKLKRKGIKLSVKELADKLITDNLIRKILLPQLNSEEDIRVDGRYILINTHKGVKAYKLVWCVADNEPHILGIMDCFRISKHDKEG